MRITDPVELPQNIVAYVRKRDSGDYHRSLNTLVESFGAGFHIYKEKHIAKYLYHRWKNLRIFFGKIEYDKPNGASEITYFYQLEKLILDHQRATTALAIYLSSGQYNSQAFIDQTADQLRAIIFAETSPVINPDHTILFLESSKTDSSPKTELVDKGEITNIDSEVSVKELVIAYVYLTEFDYFKGQSVREQIRAIASKHGKSPDNLYNTYCTFMKNKDWLTPRVVPHLKKAIKVLEEIGLVASIRRAEADLLHLTSIRR